jgi:GAF domain-containing protein
VAEHRLDLHNAACDKVVATAGLCANSDLRTGRVCIRRARHRGSCDFVPSVTARAVAAELREMASSDQEPITALDDPVRVVTARRIEARYQNPSPVFDRLTLIAAELLDAPVALLSVVEPDGQFFLGAHGLPENLSSQRRTPLEYSICQYAVASGAPFIVTDASREPRLAANRAVRELGVAAYAGIPVIQPRWLVLGALCVIDFVSRDWRDDQLTLLDTLANLCSAELAADATDLDVTALDRADLNAASRPVAVGSSGTAEPSLA